MNLAETLELMRRFNPAPGDPPPPPIEPLIAMLERAPRETLADAPGARHRCHARSTTTSHRSNPVGREES